MIRSLYHYCRSLWLAARLYTEDVPARLDEWTWDYRERTGQEPDWELWHRIAERHRAAR